MITNNEINKYIKEIRKQLLYGTRDSRQFLKTLKQNIADYVEENQGADMAQVTEQFGKPEDIAATFFEQYGKEDIKKKINIKKAFVFFAMIIAIIIAVAMVIIIIDTHGDGHGHISVTIEEGTTIILAFINSIYI